MVDATGFGTVCMTLRHKRDMETLFSALGGDNGLELTRDVTLGSGDDLDMIDANKSLAMIAGKVVTSGEEALEEFKKAHGLVGEDGKFQKSVKIAFFNMKAVEGSVAGIADNIKKQDAAKAKKAEEERIQEEERLEAEQDAKDVGNLSYYPTKMDWVIPEAAKVADDIRKSDPRLVAGGAPQCLDATQEKVIKRDKTRPNWRPITKYMLGEPDARGDFKVYIEDPEVVASAKSKIDVEFFSTSYSVRVETDAEPLVLGPVECGQLDVRACSWRLSEGKRLTISLVKASTDAKTPRPLKKYGPEAIIEQEKRQRRIEKEMKRKEARKAGPMAQLWQLMTTILPVAISVLFFYAWKSK